MWILLIRKPKATTPVVGKKGQVALASKHFQPPSLGRGQPYRKNKRGCLRENEGEVGLPVVGGNGSGTASVWPAGSDEHPAGRAPLPPRSKTAEQALRSIINAKHARFDEIVFQEASTNGRKF